MTYVARTATFAGFVHHSQSGRRSLTGHWFIARGEHLDSRASWSPLELSQGGTHVHGRERHDRDTRERLPQESVTDNGWQAGRTTSESHGAAKKQKDQKCTRERRRSSSNERKMRKKREERRSARESRVDTSRPTLTASARGSGTQGRDHGCGGWERMHCSYNVPVHCHRHSQTDLAGPSSRLVWAHQSCSPFRSLAHKVSPKHFHRKEPPQRHSAPCLLWPSKVVGATGCVTQRPAPMWSDWARESVW